MANISISLAGIDQAIENLNYRPGSVKQNAILAIRAFYISEDSLKQVNAIDMDTLIKSIWDVGDDLSKIKTKRRNFSSIKSSINADLEKLSKKEKNPENITISDSNIFDMTEEAKNNLLSSFTDAVKTGDINLDQATHLLKAVTDFLENFQMEDRGADSEDIINQIKKILNKITEDVLSKEELESTPGMKKFRKGAIEFEEIPVGDEVDEIELDEDEEIEEIDDIDEIDELLPDVEEVDITDDPDEDVEEIELDEDQELVEVDAGDEDQAFDEIDATSEDQAPEETDGLDEAFEEIPSDDEIDEIELDEDEEIEEIDDIDEIDEIDELLPDVEEVDITDEPDEDVDEIELDEDQELIEVDAGDENQAVVEVDTLDKDELKVLEEYRKKKELAEHFDETLGDREKKFNQYATVPAGKYTVGTKKSLKSSLELQQFDMPKVHIGIYPVTNSLFEIFIEQTGYVTTAEKKGFGRVYHSRFKKNAGESTWNKTAGSEDIKGACWYQPFGPDSTLHDKRSHPVVQVSVEDAIAFAAWIGRRIPTEAEWEAAARTDIGYTYPWGDDFNPEAFNIEQSGFSGTCAVDRYDSFANEFKIVDMLGNVMEWTSDIEAPPPPVKSKNNITYCIAKGAAWNAKKEVTISSRALFKPGFTSNTVGFRCVSEMFL